MNTPWTLDPTLSDSLDAGWALPATWYTDADIARLERDRIFARSWQLFATTDLVAEPGSFHAERIGHIPLVVTRDRDGVLRGFVNVCRHRGHLVAEGSGCRATLQCPYHAWTYGLDGSLVKAPRAEREPGVRPLGAVPASGCRRHLGAVRVRQPRRRRRAARGVARGDPGAGGGIRPRPHRPATAHADRVGAPVNWKNALENYLECYHCAVAHPGFSKLLDVDPDAYELIRGRPLSSSQVGKVRAGVRRGHRPGAVCRRPATSSTPSTT